MKKTGFTLVELLIIVSIIAVLIAIVLVVMNPNQTRAKGRDGIRVNDLHSIQSALEVYHADQADGAYPACNSTAASCLYNSSGPLSTYMTEFPADPAQASPTLPCTSGASVNYYYYYRSSAGSYVVAALLESYTNLPQGAVLCTDIPNWTAITGCASAPVNCIAVTAP